MQCTTNQHLWSNEEYMIYANKFKQQLELMRLVGFTEAVCDIDSGFIGIVVSCADPESFFRGGPTLRSFI